MTHGNGVKVGQGREPTCIQAVGRAQPAVCIILVNWNARDYTLACLASLQALSYSNYTVLVVDNASSDGSPDAITSAYPGVSLLRLPNNQGFTGANNAGFRYAVEHDADFVYLLNTDTHMAPDFLARAVEAALSDPSIGIVGSKVLHASRPDRLQFMGQHVNLCIGYSGRPIGYDHVDRGQYDYIRDVDRATGCAMLVSRACLKATNGFDDRFFAFHEDVDLCLRARAAGFRVVMSPESRVWHEGGGSTGGPVSATHIYYDVRNGLRLAQKHKPLPAAANLLRATCIVGAHVAQIVMGGPSRETLGAIVAGTRDYYRGMSGAYSN